MKGTELALDYQKHGLQGLWQLEYIIAVMGCGSLPNHRYHYLKSVSAATTLDNTMTYIIYNIFYNITLNYFNPDACILQWKKISTPINSS
jgi:hypothetical protein